jgi:hypothetical protein
MGLVKRPGIIPIYAAINMLTSQRLITLCSEDEM